MHELMAKQQITEVIYRYCRGMDRMDRDLTLSCWHPGGTDDHAPLYKGSAEGFVEWLWPVHAAMEGTRHVVSNILIEVDGNSAVTESYWNVQLRLLVDDELTDIQGAGRYVDQFECISDVWAIRHRTSLSDMIRVDKVTEMSAYEKPLILPNNLEAKPGISARDFSDYSYEAFKSLG
ncbi:MAG: hypothetical protein CMQ20_00940 [Gammaproteobacteria bacterium]|jgi:hypothetical protein|nr:hypothetical protein [Gammaproteobacteria bacterium]|tara:strand:- start:1446 stop:1976 length:531 start_codon:yes stop_codon:yes gene_type:complete